MRIAVVTVLIILLAGVCLAGAAIGSFPVPAGRLAAWLFGADSLSERELLVLWNLRFPRVALGALVGASLAVSGAIMQGLFRNPLADPGLLGVSSGAALAAAATIVLGDVLLAPWFGTMPFIALPLGAFFGGLATTAALYAIATRHGRTSVATMLLAGIALGALAGAFVGLLTYISDDRQLRDLTFWSLGSLGGASWSKTATIGIIVLPLFAAAPLLARSLNALLLGEAEAYYLGFKVQRTKMYCILLVAAAVGAAVAAAGPIDFVGIVVPHLVRIMLGPDHRTLLPASAILGAALLVGADIVARTVVSPAELPIGILTAAIGAPFFLWLLLRRGSRALL